MNQKQLSFIITEARAHLVECLARVLSDEGWRERRSPEELIDLHLIPDRKEFRDRRQDILSSILQSAQNRQEMNRVIGGSVKGGWVGLGRLLHGFDPVKITASWSDARALFNYIKQSGRVNGAMRRGLRSRWPQFCKSVLSASRFMLRFESGADFIKWVESFRHSPDTCAALPLVLAEEIDGFGLALACDFLKELGFEEFAKPDVHVKKLVNALGISAATSDYMVLRDLMRLEPLLKTGNLTLYGLDKYLWLIGSGRFYRVEEDGYELNIGRQIKSFMNRINKVAPKNFFPVPSLP